MTIAAALLTLMATAAAEPAETVPAFDSYYFAAEAGQEHGAPEPPAAAAEGPRPAPAPAPEREEDLTRPQSTPSPR